MLIGVISDTHGQVTTTQNAVRMFRQFEVQRVLHCGDIGSADVARCFHGLPTDFVLGNCDRSGSLDQAIQDQGHTLHGRFGDLEIGGVRIALLHGDDQRRLEETLRSGSYALVCVGHSHAVAIERFGDTLLVNPGALHRASRKTVMTIDLPSLDVVTLTL